MKSGASPKSDYSQYGTSIITIEGAKSYVVSNARIKKVLSIDKMPVSAEEGMREALLEF